MGVPQNVSLSNLPLEQQPFVLALGPFDLPQRAFNLARGPCTKGTEAWVREGTLKAWFSLEERALISYLPRSIGDIQTEEPLSLPLRKFRWVVDKLTPFVLGVVSS